MVVVVPSLFFLGNVVALPVLRVAVRGFVPVVGLVGLRFVVSSLGLAFLGAVCAGVDLGAVGVEVVLAVTFVALALLFLLEFVNVGAVGAVAVFQWRPFGTLVLSQ